jgi:phage repressor protein C with HTH and peptisase S24 domain
MLTRPQGATPAPGSGALRQVAGEFAATQSPPRVSRVAPRPEALRCVRISGDSMAPTLTDGSIVAVDVSPVPIRALQGRIVCSRTGDGGVVIKRLRLRERYALLFSDNEDQVRHPPIVVDLREVEEPIIGQVIWAWVDLR